MYLAVPPAIRRSAKWSSRSLILPAYEEEISRSSRSLTLRSANTSSRGTPLVLRSVSECHGGLFEDTENRPAARNRRCLIQKTVRPFCPSPTSAKVRCFLSRATQGPISEGRKYFARIYSRLFDHRALDNMRNKKACKSCSIIKLSKCLHEVL